jgi:hypothetical protein
MRKILLILSTLLIFSSPSQSEEIEGEMICKVKTNYVVSIDEGVSKVYSGIEDSFSKGDDLVFKFYSDNLPGFAKIKLLYKDMLLASSSINNSKYSSDKIELSDYGFRYGPGRKRISFSSDFIIFTSSPNIEFRIKRYYKGDWSGIISGWTLSYDSIGAKVATLDCRQSSDKVDDFIQYVRGLAENE